MLSDIQAGDTVLMRNLLTANKLTTTFGKAKYTVLKRTGARAIVKDQETGATYERNVSHLKKIVLSTSDSTFEFEDNSTVAVSSSEEPVTPTSDNEDSDFQGFSGDDGVGMFAGM